MSNKPVIIDEFQVNLSGDFREDEWVYDFIERFEHCHCDFGMDGRSKVTRPGSGVHEEYHDTSPQDGHIEYAKVWIFKRERTAIRIRGIQRPTHTREPNAPTVTEYMAALREYMKGLPAYLAQVKKRQSKSQRRTG